MKKLLSTIIISIMVLSIFCMNIYAAFTANLEASVENTEVNPGDEVKIKLKVKDIADAGTGIAAIEGVLEYDESFFEPTQQNSIAPGMMNPETGKWLWTGLATAESEIATITLKVKSDAKGTGNVKITNIAYSTGEADATSGDINFDIKIKDNTEPPVNNNTTDNNTTTNNTATNNTTTNNTTTNNTATNNTTTNNTQTNNTVANNTATNNTSTTTPGKDDTTAGNKLPNAGTKFTLIGLVTIAGIVATISYKHYKKYEKI